VGKSIVTAALLAIGYVIRGIYLILIGWWLPPLLRSTTDRQIQTEIQRDLAFLFQEFGAGFVPGQRMFRWGGVVTVEVQNILLQIALGRGEYTARLAPSSASPEWAPVSFAVNAIHPRQSPIREVPATTFSSVEELARLLRPNFSDLLRAYQPENYPATKEALQRISETARREWADWIGAEVARTKLDRARLTANKK
jgi:hypothetical protein